MRRILFGIILAGGIAALIAGRMDDPLAGRLFQIAGLLIVAPIIAFMIWAQLATTHEWIKPVGEALGRLPALSRYSRKILYGSLLVVAAIVSLYGTIWWQGKNQAEPECKSFGQLDIGMSCDGQTLLDEATDRVVEKMKQSTSQ